MDGSESNAPLVRGVMDPVAAATSLVTERTAPPRSGERPSSLPGCTLFLETPVSAPSYPAPNQLPPHGYAPPPPTPRNGLGTAGFVLGLLAALFAMIPIIGVIAWPLAILGLVFGLVGISRARKGAATNMGLAIAGTVLSTIGLVLCIAWVAAVGSAASEVGTGLDALDTAAPIGAVPTLSLIHISEPTRPY